MKKSANVTLTLVAAMGIAARAQQRPEPCEAATFNEQACHEAIQAGGYCWNGKWVRLTYHYPFPYYYDLYWEHVTQGGVVSPAQVGTCRPWLRTIMAAHGHGASGGAAHGGFGSSGACHSSGG